MFILLRKELLNSVLHNSANLFHEKYCSLVYEGSIGSGNKPKKCRSTQRKAPGNTSVIFIFFAADCTSSLRCSRVFSGP